MKNKNIFLDNLREKRAFSLASEKAKTEQSEPIPISIKNNKNYQNFYKFPAIISPHNSQNSQKCFKFIPPFKIRTNNEFKIKSKSNSNESRNENSLAEFREKKSINFTKSFKLINSDEKFCFSSKTFHFLDDEKEMKLKNEGHIKNEISNLMQTRNFSKNKYLPYLAICNKNSLDETKNKENKNNFLLSKDNAMKEKKKEVFLTNFQPENISKIFKKFKLGNIIIQKSAIFEEKSSIKINGLKKNEFSHKEKICKKMKKDNIQGQKDLSCEKIKEENRKNEAIRHYDKIKHLMEFAEKINKIIYDQKQKINSLVEDVTTKFEMVINN